MKQQNITYSPFKITAFAMAVGCIGSVQANEDTIERISVTANRSAMLPSLSNQVVIEQQDIIDLQPNSLTELLQMVAGIDMSQQGGKGQSTSLFVRGTDNSHLLIIVDGVRLGSATLGSADIQQLSPEQIERIEIIKGPRAAVWGSDAIGGVIQVFTKDNSSSNAKLVAGSRGFRQVALNTGLNYQSGQVAISLNSEQSDGFDVLQGAEPDNDGYQQTNINIRGEHTFNEQWHAQYLINSVQTESEYDNAWAGNNEVKSDNFAWKASAIRQVNQGSLTQVSVGQNQDKSTNFGKHLPSSSETQFTTLRDQLSLVHFEKVNSTVGIQTGVDWHQEKVSGTTEYDVDSRVLYGVYGQTYIELNQHTFEAALRYDNVENIDSEVTYNLGWGLDGGTFGRYTLTLGTGFKAPTFNDLYYPTSAYSAGNPDLKSERSLSIELNWSQSWGNHFVSVSAFDSEIEQLIEWKSDENFVYKPVNVDSADISGVEVNYRVNLFDADHQFSWANIDAVDASSDLALIRRAKRQFNYSVSKQFAAWNVVAQYQYRGKRADEYYDSEIFDTRRTVLDAYGIINLNVSYRVTERLTLDVKANNLLDESYVTAYGYNTEGQTIYVGARYQ